MNIYSPLLRRSICTLHTRSLHTDIHNMSAEQTSVPTFMLCMSIDISLHGRVILCSSCLSFYLFFFSLRRGRVFCHANMTGTVHSSRMQSIQNMLAKARVLLLTRIHPPALARYFPPLLCRLMLQPYRPRKIFLENNDSPKEHHD